LSPTDLKRDTGALAAWEITHHCNARCLHCYSNSGPEADPKKILPLDAALSLIDQLADAGVLVMRFRVANL